MPPYDVHNAELCLEQSPEFDLSPEFNDSGRDSPTPEVLLSWGSFSLSAAIIFQGGMGVTDSMFIKRSFFKVKQ